MRKKKMRNMPLYLLFFVYGSMAAKRGADGLFWLSAALTGTVLVLDILEAARHGRDEA